jgi:tetratricopeptide (TPR) repeat protein
MKVEKTRRFKFAVAVTVSAVTLLVYFAALRNDFVNWDDGQYVFENPHIRSLNAAFFKWVFFDFYASNWHPLTWLSHALDYALWGLNPLGHHLTNIVLHAVNAFIVVFLVIRLLEAWKERVVRNQSPSFLNRREILIAAGTTGLLFGLHPVHVESVAWVAERKDLLCALFFLLSIILYMKYAGDADRELVNNNTTSRLFNRHYLSSLGLFILALLSKSMAVTLPVVLLVLDWYPFNRVRSWKTLGAAVVEKIPFSAFSLASSIITIMAQQSGRAMATMAALPLPTRLLVAVKSLTAYLLKMLFPLDLIPFYPYPNARDVSLFSMEYLLAIACVTGITAACIVIVKKQKLWLSVWLFYVIMLLPVLGIIQVGIQAMADRYTYLPGLGPSLIIGLSVARGTAQLNRTEIKSVKVFSAAAAIIVLLFLLYFNVKQIGIWKNSISLWSYVIKKEPERVFFAYINRGPAYENLGQLDKALADYDTAISLNPSSYEVYNNRGIIFEKMGRLDKAIEDYTMSIILNLSNFDAYNNRGIVYGKMGQLDRAIADYDIAIRLNPFYHRAYLNRGESFEKLGQFDRAIIDYSTAITIYPDNIDAYSDRGVAYTLIGQYGMALDDLNKALTLNRNSAEAYFNRGRLYSKAGQTDLARADYQKACDLGYEQGCNALR